jgi:hypothetical protein
MPRTRRRFELIFFGLYLAAIFIGTSMEALAQMLPR